MRRSRSSESVRGGRWHPAGVLLTGATAAALTIGAVSVGAFDTLQVSLFDNTSTAEGSHVPTPIITVDGTALELVYTADGEIAGNGPQEWILSNKGDADGVWDGAFVRDVEVDDAVAAATRVEVTLIIDWSRLGTWYQAAVDLDLGTLADPISLTEAHKAWVDEARDELHPTTGANGAIKGSARPRPRRRRSKSLTRRAERAESAPQWTDSVCRRPVIAAMTSELSRGEA